MFHESTLQIRTSSDDRTRFASILSSISFFFTLLLLALSTAAPSAAQSARDDIVLVAAWQPTEILWKRLLLNDVVPPFSSVSLVDKPPNLSLEGGRLVYRPAADGRDEVVRYRIDSPQGSSAAEVILRQAPAFQPIVGQWPVCKEDGDCGVDGEAEIALFDASRNQARFCDLEGWKLEGGCVLRTLDVETLLEQELLQWPDPWLPLIESAGAVPGTADTLVLVHPASGRFSRFELSELQPNEPWLQPLPGTRGRYEELGPDELPIAVRATEDGPQLLAAYSLGHRQLRVFGEPLTLITSFDPGSGAMPEPLFGDWAGGGEETLGLWESVSGTFHYLVDHVGHGSVIEGPWLDAGGEPIAGVPLKGRPGSSATDEIALYSFENYQLSIRFPRSSACGPGQSCAVHQTIKLDPLEKDWPDLP